MLYELFILQLNFTKYCMKKSKMWYLPRFIKILQMILGNPFQTE